jgi:hypothetical protein
VIDSVTQAEKAYCNIEFNSATIAGRRLQIAIQLPSRYIETNQVIAAEQLANAGVHLAQLLNAIQWP